MPLTSKNNKNGWTKCRKNIQFSLEAIDLDKDIEMTDELFRNEDVEEDCALWEEEISSFDFFVISLLFYLS